MFPQREERALWGPVRSQSPQKEPHGRKRERSCGTDERGQPLNSPPLSGYRQCLRPFSLVWPQCHCTPWPCLAPRIAVRRLSPLWTSSKKKSTALGSPSSTYICAWGRHRLHSNYSSSYWQGKQEPIYLTTNVWDGEVSESGKDGHLTRYHFYIYSKRTCLCLCLFTKQTQTPFTVFKFVIVGLHSLLIWLLIYFI